MYHAVHFHGETLHLMATGALYWPREGLLCVSDLHLGKSERLARRGGALLPPYETRATLTRLDADLEATGARRVICLGDSFDDAAALDGLDEADRLWLIRLMAGRDWVWIEGNHDAGPLDIAGSHRAEWIVQPLVFRHIAADVAQAEVSGHYHPKMRLAGQSMRCFLADAQRIVMPAYGAYTGGLWADHPAFHGLLGASARAYACARAKVHEVPMPRASTNAR